MAKSGTHFQFKQFTVYHDRSTMKVGTDGVLLGAWADVSGAKRILDIGSGSGVIALMLAQRTTSEAIIHAVEIEKSDAEQSIENVARSPWPKKIVVHNVPLQGFTGEEPFDLIVSNPPYFNNSWQPPDKRRHVTRHTDSLPYPELLASVKRLLHPEGRFNLILPLVEGEQFITLGGHAGLFCTRRWSFRTREGKPIERLLMEFRFEKKELQTGEILLYSDGENWSEGYEDLTRNFYLKVK